MKKIIVAMSIMLVLLLAATSVSAQNSPVLRYSLSTQEPMPAEPGRPVDVWVTVQNIGDRDARDIEIKFVDSFPFRLVSEQDRVKTISVLGTQRDYALRYRVMVASDAPEGTSSIQLTYKMADAPGVEATARVPVLVQTSRAVLHVSNIVLEPEQLVPGGTSELVLSLKNLASGESLRDVTVALGLNPIIAGNTVLADIPIVPAGSTNQKSVNRIAPGQTSEFRFNLDAYPDADAGIYKVPMYIAYTNDAGRFFNQTTIIGVKINDEPDLAVLVDNTDLHVDRMTGEIVFSIVNKGLADVKLLTITLEESDDYELISASRSVYIGNIFSDDYQTVRYRVKALNSDTVLFPITLEYRDALNNQRIETFNIQHEVCDVCENDGAGAGVVIVVVLVLLIAGIWYYRKRKKRRSEE